MDTQNEYSARRGNKNDETRAANEKKRDKNISVSSLTYRVEKSIFAFSIQF